MKTTRKITLTIIASERECGRYYGSPDDARICPALVWKGRYHCSFFGEDLTQETPDSPVLRSGKCISAEVWAS